MGTFDDATLGSMVDLIDAICQELQRQGTIDEASRDRVALYVLHAFESGRPDIERVRSDALARFGASAGIQSDGDTRLAGFGQPNRPEQ